MSKGKLAKFAELNTFSNVIQPSFEEVFQKEFYLRGKWNMEFFPVALPLTLELGCGKGEYTVSLAKLYPERNFLGIDIKGNRIWKGAKLAGEEQIKNAAFLRTRIDFVTSFFAKDEVDEIWITFPDPQPKKPLKRLTSSRFLNKYNSFLTDGGWINLKTDNADLYEYTRALIKHNRLETEFSTNDLYGSEYNNEILSIKTFYEKIWLSEGLKIHYLRFRLRANHVVEEPPGEY